MRPWARLILLSAGIRVRVETRAALDPAQPVVFVANHQNALDILTTAAAIRYPFGFAAKSGLRKMPFIGWVLTRTASVFVDRSTPRRTAETMILAARQIREGHAVLLFAEGGRTYSRGLGPFLRGAFMLAVEAGVPLVPVALWGTQRLMTKDHPRDFSRGTPIRIAVGPPLHPAGTDPVAETAELATAMASVLDTAIASYADAHLHPGAWWVPASRGGRAPDPVRAAELDAEEKRARAARRSAQ